MFKGEIKVNQFLNQWLFNHDFDAECEMGDDFWVNLASNTIYYSPWASEEDIAETYMEEVSKDFPELATFDEKIIAFFHEIGHIETEDEWTDKEWVNWRNQKEEEEMTDVEYFRSPIEWRATEWACEYILANYEEIKIFCKQFYQLMDEFYDINAEIFYE